MQKIPTLFIRQFENHKIIKTTHVVTPGCEIVLQGLTTPTVKWDGSCCAIINDIFYKRYDAKPGRLPPAGAIPCSDPDPVTGHHPHWVKIDENNPSDKWFIEAYKNSDFIPLNGTYEAIGKHFNGNPYNLEFDRLIPHGIDVITEGLNNTPLTYNDIKDYLETHNIEGIVFWYGGKPLCKIKRSDFGFKWPAL